MVRRFPQPALLVAIVFFVTVTPSEAYVGPGAGFVLLTSFLTLLTTIVVVLSSLLILPFRLAFRALKRSMQVKPLVRRLIIAGLDGQDPKLTERFMSEGKLPNFARLAALGAYRPLATTFPAVSPLCMDRSSRTT